jgi:light-regulated signal transduction histidine kinase (bacteriophytochrome)
MLEHEKLEVYSKELEERVQLRLDEVKEKSAKLEESQRALTYLLEDVNESRTELETANRNLQMLNRELEAFTYSVSHDLRAPIRAIDGFSRILMEENANQLDDEGKRLLSIIVKSASNMQRLIDDLLAFSRLGPKQPAMHKIDSGVLISNIIEELKTVNADRKITWKVSDLPEIYGDQGMLRQVFANIIGNAVKFSAKSQEALIEIGGEYTGKTTKVWIKDNGVGFDMQYVRKIFEVFQRLHDSKEFEGTGIGMAIVKKILDKHNGQIVPESLPGVGSIFTIELPHL